MNIGSFVNSESFLGPRSQAPLFELKQIAGIEDADERVKAMDAWFEDNVANVALFEPRCDGFSEDRFEQTLREFCGREVSKLVAFDESGIANLPGQRGVLASLSVIVPRGIENPSKRAELEPKEATAS